MTRTMEERQTAHDSFNETYGQGRLSTSLSKAQLRCEWFQGELAVGKREQGSWQRKACAKDLWQEVTLCIQGMKPKLVWLDPGARRWVVRAAGPERSAGLDPIHPWSARTVPSGCFLTSVRGPNSTYSQE